MNGAALQPIVEALGWTLVHFLWQGAVIGIAFGVTMRLMGSTSPRLRYRTALAWFLAAGLAPLATFWLVYESAAGAAAIPLGGAMTAAAGAASGGAEAPWWLALEGMLEPYLPWAVALWLAGVIVMSGRVCLDWWQVRRLTWVGVAPLPPEWEARVADLVRTFGVSHPVRVLRSTIVRVPAVIGWLRPVILLPTAALAGLSARQLELIIAHELAHIRRADYLVNLLQVMIETVLFYHPVVRWMSNRLRQERELCCDDAVIGTCGDTLTYAHALTELEAQRQESYKTALAASGGHLSQRIYRMLDRPVPRRNTLIWSMSLVAGLAAGSMALAAQFALTNATVPGPAGVRLAAVTAPDVAPKPAAIAVERPDATEPGVDSLTAEGAASATPTQADAGTVDAEPAGATAKPEPEPVTRVAPPRGETPNGSPSLPRDKALPDGAPAERSASDATPAEDATTTASPEASPGRTADATESEPAVDATTATTTAEPSARSAVPAEDEALPDREPTRLASATRPDSKAAAPPRPEVRGGEPLHVSAPEYPRRARLRGLQGSVTAVFTIDRDGEVRDIEITESSPAGVFDRAVSEALAEWRFRPLTRDGEAVARRVSKEFDFNLDGGRDGRSQDVDDCDPVTGTRICRQWSAAPGEFVRQ